MTSPPMGDSKRGGFRKSLRQGFVRVINTAKPSPHLSLQNSGSISPLVLSGGVKPASATPSSAKSGRHRSTQPSPAQVSGTDKSSGPSNLGTSPPFVRLNMTTSVNPKPTTVGNPGEAGDKALSRLNTALRALERSADVSPPLQSAIGGVAACLGIIQSAATNSEDYEQLTSELTMMAGTLSQYLGELGQEHPSEIAEQITASIGLEVARIDKMQGRGKGRRTIESAQDGEDIIKSYRRIEGLFRRLQGDMGLQTLRSTNKLRVRTLLQDMSPVDDAQFNSSYSRIIKRRGCTAETREQVQAELQQWIRDPNGAKVYWMNGMAGTGKTTIAYSLCEWLEKNQQLGASFFCSRASSSCRNVDLIMPTIAYQLALSFPAFQSALCKVLEANPSTSKLNVVQQFEKLVREPMEMSRSAMATDVVVVVDALDECEDEYGVQLILGTLLKLGTNLPLKFFVTSRPEPGIQDEMLSRTEYSPAILRLHDIEESIVEADIKKYLAEALGSMVPPPPDEQVEKLAKLSGKLFIYAATAVRYITYSRGDSIERLNGMFAVHSQPTENRPPSKRYRELDELYTTIVAGALSDNELEEKETEAMRLVLWTVICAKEPMTIPTLASFINVPEGRASAALKPLHSVLHVSEGSGLVSTLHASFPDYMLNRRRSGDLYCDQTRHSKLLARHCFDVMKEQLRFNICDLGSSFAFDTDVPDLDQLAKKHVSPLLFYACQYWGDHLRLVNSSGSDECCTQLAEFLKNRLLFWVEVLNLRRRAVKGISILSCAESWLSGAKAPEDIQRQASDAQDFVTRFAASACRRSTPHLYISALPFCAKSSSVYAHYWERTRGLMDVSGTAMRQREKAAQATWMTNSGVNSIAFSPDGRRIVSGSDDCTIRVWNARTGEAVAGPFEGHTNTIMSARFSPDGTHIVSGSHDGTVRVWDARTGDVIAGPFKGHIGAVRSVRFSPDGARIVSGSHDHTIRVWDTSTGNTIAGPFKGHTSMVNSVVFSPDGTRIASGSDDRTIRMWDAHTGRAITGPFEGHTSMVNSVGFSPNGTQIVSSSHDRTIRVWDTRTGNIVAGPFRGHTSAIRSAEFSPDGARIVSSCSDGTIRMWDARTGDTVAGWFEGHTRTIGSVGFSPDGTRIVSGSHDCTIRVWDARSHNTVTEMFDRHTKAVRSVRFSPDGARIVSGSDDGTIRVWGARTGNAIAGPFTGHTNAVNSVDFSPDGTRIVSGSNDCTVRVWGTDPGDAVAGLFEGHKNAVSWVRFSPDGARIISGSSDSTIRVWDARTSDPVAEPFKEDTSTATLPWHSPDGTRIVSGLNDCTFRVLDARTGNAVTGPFKGHEKEITSIGFSPDCSRIVSGSDDYTIRVWDARTSLTIAGPFVGHTSAVRSAEFSPDGSRVVSGSDDRTIRVWDARTGDAVTRLLEAHTSAINPIPNRGTQLSHIPSSIHSVKFIRSLQPIPVPREDTQSTANFNTHLDTLPRGTPNQPSIGVVDFEFRDDGWVTSGGIPLFWTPPDLRTHLPYAQDEFVIGPLGTLSIDYEHMLLGKNWTQCYTSP